MMGVTQQNGGVGRDLVDDVATRQLRLGFDASGRLLELIVLRFDSGNELLIPSMKARPQYYELLP